MGREMSREIKFRAWTGSAMEYRVVVGSLGAFYVEGLDPKDSASMSMMNTLYSKNTPTMQFTGLKDKNGKEIYEGDIVGNKYPCVIEWGTSKCAEFVAVGKDGVIYSLFNDGVYEVIGNIYESKHLLDNNSGK
jgi:uncharacterized phage protein (TIGR01671 family)